MFDIEKVERNIIIFLCLTLFFGLGIAAYNKLRPSASIKIEKFALSERDEDNLPIEEKININEAGVEELMDLRGIGRVTAERIIDHRAVRGNFSSIDEIKNVKGVGQALFDKIKDRITVE